MTGIIRATLIGVAVATTLVACASKGSVSPTSKAATAANADDQLAAEYQSLIDNAMGQTVCQQQTVTGSRIANREVCVTRAQRTAERDYALQLLQEMHERTMAMPPPVPDNSASAPSSP